MDEPNSVSLVHPHGIGIDALKTDTYAIEGITAY
jgi:hypothetical protein